jgi:ribosomal-protein-alanine N-acetyltransferase
LARTHLELEGPEVYVRPPTAADRDRFLGFTRRNTRFHRPWVHPPRTALDYAAYLARFRAERHLGLLVLSRNDDALVGAIHLNEIVWGNFGSAYLGYFGSRDHTGRGWMRAGLTLVLSIGFRRLGLHRVEANIQPENERSIRLVRSLGFRREGLSPRYLKIGGRWRDHERWALLAEEWRP